MNDKAKKMLVSEIFFFENHVKEAIPVSQENDENNRVSLKLIDIPSIYHIDNDKFEMFFSELA